MRQSKFQTLAVTSWFIVVVVIIIMDKKKEINVKMIIISNMDGL